MSQHQGLETDDARDLLLRETREELAKADTKASILLAASGIALSALLTAGTSAHWYPENVKDDTARSLAWAAGALTIIGMLFVGAAVKPRLRAKHGGTPALVHYFGDVEAFRLPWWRLWRRRQATASARAAFAATLEKSVTVETRSDRLVDQIWTLSHIAWRKYRLVSFGMWSFAAAIALAITALVIEKQWV